MKTGILIVSESLLVTRCVARSKPIDLALPGGKFCFSNCAVVVSRARVNGARSYSCPGVDEENSLTTRTHVPL